MKKQRTQDRIITSILTAIVFFLILAVFGQSQAAMDFNNYQIEDNKQIQVSVVIDQALSSEDN